jgi:hypothetical protein
LHPDVGEGAARNRFVRGGLFIVRGQRKPRDADAGRDAIIAG